jgi:hypothetical protein
MRQNYRAMLLASAVAVFAFAPAAHAITITNDYLGNAPQEGDPPATSSSGNFLVGVTGSSSGNYLSPYASNTNYSTVSANWAYDVLGTNNGTESATFNVNASTFTLLWGSPDVYNTVTLYDGSGDVLETIKGSQLACYVLTTTSACDGKRFDLVTFTDTAETIAYAVLSDSGEAAFEFGIQTLGGGGQGSTPLPTTAWLFGSVMLAWLGASRWRRTASLVDQPGRMIAA